MKKGMLVVVGFMLAGKTTAVEYAARNAAIPFLDLDQLIADRAQKSISEIFALAGEAEFRRLETAEFARLIAASEALTLVAVGGGLPLAHASREQLKNCTVIFLDTDFATIAERLSDACSRPLLSNLTLPEIERLFASRREIYHQVADFVVKDKQQLSDMVVQLQNSRSKNER